jgi:molecular chaperone GrpE
VSSSPDSASATGPPAADRDVVGSDPPLDGETDEVSSSVTDAADVAGDVYVDAAIDAEVDVDVDPSLDLNVDEELDALSGDSDRDGIDSQADVARERDDYLDALLRLQAEFENYKKRMQRQQAETTARAGEDLAVKLLPVLDTIDLARQHGEGDAIAPVASALFEVLAKEGLDRIDPVGQPFDPNEHEAVSHEPSEDGGEPLVTGLMRAGYRWKGRLLRAAMVTVRG